MSVSTVNNFVVAAQVLGCEWFDGVYWIQGRGTEWHLSSPGKLLIWRFVFLVSCFEASTFYCSGCQTQVPRFLDNLRSHWKSSGNPVPCQSEIARAGEWHAVEVNMKLVRNLWFMQFRPEVNEYSNLLRGGVKDSLIQFFQLGSSVGQPPTFTAIFTFVKTLDSLTASLRRLVKEHSEGSLCFALKNLEMTGMDWVEQVQTDGETSVAGWAQADDGCIAPSLHSCQNPLQLERSCWLSRKRRDAQREDKILWVKRRPGYQDLDFFSV